MRYNFYIDIDDGNGWVEITPKNIEPLEIIRDKGDYFYRLGWGKITLVNDPVMYELTGLSVYSLFDILQSPYYGVDSGARSGEIRVKVESTKLLEKFPSGVQGYFYHSDCSFDFDRRIVEVTPTILDKYTDILENWENEVDFENYTEYGGTLSVVIDTPNLVRGCKSPLTQAQWYYPKKQNMLEQYVEDSTGLDGEDYRHYSLYAWFDETTGKPIAETLDKPVEKDQFGLRFTDSKNFTEIINYYQQEPVGGWENKVNIGFGDWELSKLTIYYGEYKATNERKIYTELYMAREYVEIKDINGIVTPPVGAGWHSRGRTTDNTATIYTRRPFNGAYGFDSAVDWILTWKTVQTGFKTEITKAKVYASLTSSADYPSSTNSIDIESSLGLRDFMEYLVRNTCNNLPTNVYSASEFKSTFFWNDDEVASGIKRLESFPGTNYVLVSEEPNYLNYLRVFFKKILKTDTNDNGEVTSASSVSENLTVTAWKDFFENLNNLFNNKLFWWVDDDLDFHIEHIAYVDYVLKYADFYDIAADPVNLPLLDYTRKWNYDKAEQWGEMNYEMVDAGYVDFTKQRLEFSKIVSNIRNKDKKKTITVNYISTDLRYAIENPNDLERGVILVCCDSENNIRNRIGHFSMREDPNGFMAMSNLILDFGIYEGVWVDGKHNDENIYFENTTRTKLGIEHTLKGTILSLFYNTFSENPAYGIGIGLIESGKLDLMRENTKIKLRYRYLTEGLVDQWALVIQRADQIEFENPQDIWHDIDNYEA